MTRRPVAETLVSFIYLLTRDELVPGLVTKLCKECLGHPVVEFTNPYLEAYARDVADSLVNDSQLYKHVPGSYVRKAI